MLQEILSTDIYKFLLIFARLGAAIMFFPAFGGVLVPPRARLMLALAITFLMLPLIGPRIPPVPQAPAELGAMLFMEVTIGIFFGVITQLLMAAMDLAGTFIGYSTGLTNALVSDPVTAQQSQLITGFLNLLVVTVLLLTNTHHLMLMAVASSYDLFKPGAPLMTGDMANEVVKTLGRSFVVGMELSAPMVIFALVFNTALGLLNRLVPQMQVFFVGMPVQIMGGLAILMITLPAMVLYFLRHFTEGIGAFVPR